MPGGHGLDCRASQFRLVNGPSQGGLGRLEAIYPDHDARALRITSAAHLLLAGGLGRPGHGQYKLVVWPDRPSSLILVAWSLLARTRVSRPMNS